jgi:hypothetical protein
MEKMDSLTVANYLEITVNNLRQIQYRGGLRWITRKGKSVYYNSDEVKAYKETRDQNNRR